MPPGNNEEKDNRLEMRKLVRAKVIGQRELVDPARSRLN